LAVLGPVDLGNYGVGIPYLNQLPTNLQHQHIVITAQHNGKLDGHRDDKIIACTDETDRRCNEPLLTIDHFGYGFSARAKCASRHLHRFPSDSRYLVPFSGLSFRRSEHEGKLSKLTPCTLSRFFQEPPLPREHRSSAMQLLQEPQLSIMSFGPGVSSGSRVSVIHLPDLDLPSSMSFACSLVSEESHSSDMRSHYA
jgi:hypothetical protein